MSKNPFIHLMETPLGHYLYDVNTNTQLRISEESHRYLSNGCDALESGAVPDEITALLERGYLQEKRSKKIEHPMTNRLVHELDSNVYQMTLQVTKQCNFRCAYCIYGDVAFDSQRKHEADFMDLDIAKKAINFLAEHSKDQESIVVGFYGGEPLLAFPLIQDTVLYALEVFKHKKS